MGMGYCPLDMAAAIPRPSPRVHDRGCGQSCCGNLFCDFRVATEVGVPWAPTSQLHCLHGDIAAASLVTIPLGTIPLGPHFPVCVEGGSAEAEQGPSLARSGCRAPLFHSDTSPGPLLSTQLPGSIQNNLCGLGHSC